MAEHCRFPSVLAALCFFFFFFLRAVILKQHERQRGSTLAVQFDLTSQQIKDLTCEDASQEMFVEDQTFYFITQANHRANEMLAEANG